MLVRSSRSTVRWILTASLLLAACGDGMNTGDGSIGDVAADRTGSDTGTGTDVPTGTDTPTPMDVPTGTDVPVASDVPMGVDVPTGPCPAPPAGASANAIAALDRTNMVRRAMGLECQTMISTINMGAQNHCNYYTANRSISMCVSNPHNEVMGCAMFTGVSFANRIRAAGYTGSPAFEVMAFVNNGTAATQMWIDSIWHRTPVLSPWVGDMGYGGSAGCDTTDFGTGAGARVPATATASYPYANQTGVPTSFSGNEGPPPPAPPTGWPSGYPITLYFQGTFTTHTLTVDGMTAPIEHVWLAPGDARAMGLLRNEAVMYANRPLSPNTRYRVQVAGMTRAGMPHMFNYVFTTGAR